MTIYEKRPLSNSPPPGERTIPFRPRGQVRACPERVEGMGGSLTLRRNAGTNTDRTARHTSGRLRRSGFSAAVVLVLVALAAIGCYNNNTGETTIGGKINFTLPAFPETGGNAVQVFTEMHYQPSYRAQEGPRILPPPDSVPVTGREILFGTLDEYGEVEFPRSLVQSYDEAYGQALYDVNCSVCHGDGLRGDGPILKYLDSPPVPADLTATTANDGLLFAYISWGGSQGASARFRGRASASPMPEFRLLLTEQERWALLQFLRARIRQ